MDLHRFKDDPLIGALAFFAMPAFASLGEMSLPKQIAERVCHAINLPPDA